ncbi:MAG: O-phosphoserine--tRNA ligase [Methanoculleaceae archaeon]
MIFDTEEWKRKSRENFESAWVAGPSVITPPGINDEYPRRRLRLATPHPVFETIARLRQVYLALGFDEVVNPLFINEADVYRQFGPEAMAVLDRVFYLSGLPRPNVGIARAQLEGIARIIGRPVAPAVEDELRETLHAYKKKQIDGDDLVHALSTVLDAEDTEVIRILDEVFSEFRNLIPEPSRTTLRSHMTSGWFLTLGAAWERCPRPIRLFSIDRCFRREQEESPTRLMSYHSASCVVAGEDITNEEGKAVSEALLRPFGFTDVRFRPDEKRSKYYMPGTQTEVFARHPAHGWVEVATFGMYSPAALAEYGVPLPVMNLGLGVERLAMINYNAADLREMVYPQFHPRPLEDRDIAAGVRVKEVPSGLEGRLLQRAIVDTVAEHGGDPGPCSIEAWSGEIGGRRLRVFVEERESDAKLAGPAAGNEIIVHRGAVLGVPATPAYEKVLREGVSTGIRYADAVAALAAARIEEAARCGEGTTVQVKMARLPSDINIAIEDWVMRYLTDRQLKVDLRGPVFLTVRSEIEGG